MCVIRSQNAYSTLTYTVYYDAHFNHNHTIVANIKLTIQLYLLYRLIVESGFLRERGKHI